MYTEDKQIKRRKAIAACASCRQRKARCELDPRAPKRCRRCGILAITCSFESDPPAAQPQYPLPPSHSSPDWSPTSVHDVSVEYLIPTPDAPWGNAIPPELFDWLVAPVHTVRVLASRYPHPQMPAPTVVDSCLEDVLGPEEIHTLLEIFDTQYAPWLAAPPQSDVHTPLLDLVRCTVASRELEPAQRINVSPRLHRLAEAAIADQLFSPLRSPDAVLAVFIASMWPPVGAVSRGKEGLDGRLVKSAVDMAMQLSLHKESARIPELAHEDIAGSKDRARLWMAVSVAEALHCVGTDRSPVSSRSEFDRNLLSNGLVDTPNDVRDVRLKLMSSLLELAERGTRIQIVDKTDLGPFHQEVTTVLKEMEKLRQFIAPMPVVSEYQIANFQVLLACYYSYRVLVLNNAIREMRQAFQRPGSGRTWYLTIHRGQRIALEWGKEATHSAEAALTHALLPPPALLGTAPDAVLAAIAFTAVFLVLTKFAILFGNQRQLAGSGDRLLSLIVRRLAASARAPDHAPAKSARLITAILAEWDSMPKTGTVGEAELEKTLLLESGAHVFQQWNHPALAPAPAVYGATEVALDAELWSSLLEAPDSWPPDGHS